eukprot:scaffold1166_cov261-Pinguiococcus_pyrenoidosus.AAC.59
MAQDLDLAEQAQAYISEAQLAPAKRKAYLLTQVQEILGHRDPSLLPRFLPYLATFQADPSAPVRRQVLDTLGYLVSKQPNHATALLDVLKYLRHDAEISVRRRVLSVLAKFVPSWLRHAAQATVIDGAFTLSRRRGLPYANLCRGDQEHGQRRLARHRGDMQAAGAGTYARDVHEGGRLSKIKGI